MSQRATPTQPTSERDEPSPGSVPPSSRLPLSAAGIPHDDLTGGVLPGASAGVLAGAAIGAFAGPIGAIAGAAIGVAIGAAAGQALSDGQRTEELKDTKLDEELGVFGGDIGAAKPGAPPPTRGVYSGASAGVGGMGGDDTAPDEGPMPKAD